MRVCDKDIRDKDAFIFRSEQLRALMKDWTPDERVHAIAHCGYCVHCGMRVEALCCCMRDE